MQLIADDLKDQIPYYLTQKAKENLVKALNSFPDSVDYYTNRFPNEIMQGDGCSDLGVIQYETSEKKKQLKALFFQTVVIFHLKTKEIYPQT